MYFLESINHSPQPQTARCHRAKQKLSIFLRDQRDRHPARSEVRSASAVAGSLKDFVEPTKKSQRLKRSCDPSSRAAG